MKLKKLQKLQRLSTIIAAVGLTIIIVQEYVRPWISLKIYAEEYKYLAFNCDIAMHEEVALRIGDISTSEEKQLHLSAEVGMMICHDYDKLRKKMLIQGISEDSLALLGLEALEVEKITVEQMVNAHRMDRF